MIIVVGAKGNGGGAAAAAAKNYTDRLVLTVFHTNSYHNYCVLLPASENK